MDRAPEQQHVADDSSRCVFRYPAGAGKGLTGHKDGGSKSLSELGEAELRDRSFPHPSFHISPLVASQWRHF